jgi:hypothetical protein
MNKLLLIFFLTILSMKAFGQNVKGVLKSKFYVESKMNLSKDTFEIVLYNHKNEVVIKTLETGKFFYDLPAGIYKIQCFNKFGNSIIIEGVKVDYNSVSFCDINVCSLNE